MAYDTDQYNLDLIREQISVPQVLTMFNVAWDGQGNLSCLWHDDSTPSMSVYNDHVWCHGCRKWGDIFSLTAKLGRMRFSDAVDWLLNKLGILPQAIIRKVPKEYQGPMPDNILRYWHNQLDDERRIYLRDRLFTDETLDRYQIGYRGDYSAYTLPFYEGKPGESDVIALQYRMSPWSENKNKKYWWEEGRYRPCLFNQGILAEADLIVILFGTLDGLLGAQFGLPVVSASGLNTFANPNKPESTWLREATAHIKHKFVVPDGTPSEFEPALRIADLIGGQMRFFPFGEPKDFNDYLLAGNSPEDFMSKVIGA